MSAQPSSPSPRSRGEGRGEGPLTAGTLIAEGTRTLAAAQIDSPAREARLLLAGLTATDAATLFAYPERPVSCAQAAAFHAAIARRTAREPLSRILGIREFWSLPFRLGPATLDPRPDSETVVEAALDLLSARTVQWRAAPWRLVDFGTGTGCLLLALLSELPAAMGIGVDLSPDAIAVATANAEALGLAGRASFSVGSWGAGLTGPVDLVVANPPYIPDADIAMLDPEVRCFDPALALEGGTDGLASYRALAPDLVRLLVQGGHAVLEVGQGQKNEVCTILVNAGLLNPRPRADLSGVDRVVIAQKP
jgi:release factor glutamine methyltransferase